MKELKLVHVDALILKSHLCIKVQKKEKNEHITIYLSVAMTICR